ncbi:MAG: signal peptidase I [Cyanobacteria bacterium P01_F01_bin.53]
MVSKQKQQAVQDCWLAVNLSGLLPGLGQCYGGQWVKGLIILGVFMAVVLHAGWSLLAAEGSTSRAFGLMAITFFIYLINLWDAFATAGRPLHPLGSKRQGRDLWYGVFLSQILPGLGHLYLNQAVAGAVFLAVGVALAMMANYQPVLIPLACTIWSISGYHAYRSTPASPGKFHSRSGQLLMVIVIGGLLLRLSIGSIPMWIDKAILQCTIPSESMLPTLQVGDHTLVSKNELYYPETSDIVVFTIPVEATQLLEAEPDTLFVKRIVGLPGQTVEVRDGQVWINQVPLSEPYVNEVAAYQWGPEIVPTNAYFVLGDNRNASADSHVWGFLPRKNVIGEAYKIAWPPDRVRPLQKS